jgi:RNA polymerase sigma factor (sigma-70 family)
MVMEKRELSDGDVFARSVSEPHLFTIIFDRHYRAIYGYVSRRAGRAIADDIAAETFTRAFARRSSYDPTVERALPWLLGIAINLLAHHRRSEARQFRALAAAWEGGEAPSGAVDASLAERLVVGLEQLDDYDREAILLYAWGELKYEEIAVALAIPLGTVQSRIHRARRKLREALEAEGDVVHLRRRQTGSA